MTPLLALHGFTGSAATWDALAAGLAAAFPGLATERPDLPGHAGVPADAAVSVETIAAALAARLAARGMPSHLLGYSLGARIALRMAVVRPDVVRRLVLEAPSAGVVDPDLRAARRAADSELASVLENAGLQAFLDRWERQAVIAAEAGLPATVQATQRAIRERHQPAGLAAMLRGAGQGAMEPLQGRLAEVTAPTLVIVGSEDPARDRAELVAMGIPGAHLAVVPGAAHAVHLSHPETFVALVRDFLFETTEEEPAR